jgi:hypothetical protein
MKVYIKKFNVDMEVKTSGVELGIYTPDGSEHLGDLKVSKSGIEWHPGRSRSGPQASWTQLIDWMNS